MSWEVVTFTYLCSQVTQQQNPETKESLNEDRDTYISKSPSYLFLLDF